MKKLLQEELQRKGAMALAVEALMLITLVGCTWGALAILSTFTGVQL